MPTPARALKAQRAGTGKSCGASTARAGMSARFASLNNASPAVASATHLIVRPTRMPTDRVTASIYDSLFKQDSQR